MELVLLYIALAAAGGFGVSKGVELWKHSDTIEADKYASCVKYAEEVRHCRGLE
jgi:hypothetical protein